MTKEIKLDSRRKLGLDTELIVPMTIMKKRRPSCTPEGRKIEAKVLGTRLSHWPQEKDLCLKLKDGILRLGKKHRNKKRMHIVTSAWLGVIRRI